MDLELFELRQEFRDDADRGRAEEWDSAESYCNRVLRFDLRRVRETPPSAPADVLVLLCGGVASHAPVFLSVAWLQPGHVVVVGPDAAPGLEVGAEVSRALQVGAFPDVTGMVVDVEVAPDMPAVDLAAAKASLRALLAPLVAQHGADRVVVDVTCGRKAAVAAAYTVARDLGYRVQYVDHDEWDASADRPKPGSALMVEA